MSSSSHKLYAFSLPTLEPANYAEKSTNKGWVEYGDGNAFPDYLLTLYNESALHHALCDGIAYMMHGEGYAPTDLTAKLRYEQFNLDEELLKCQLDYIIHGGFALEVQWSLDRTTIESVYHCPFENIRAGVCGEDGVVHWYYYSTNWHKHTTKKHRVRAWAPDEANEYPRQILYVKPFSPGSYYYPKPSYIGAINYIELDKEIGLFHVNNIRNGLMPSFMINFKNGEPNEMERHAIRAEIESQIGGASNAGKWFMTFNDQPERAPDFIPFPTSDNDTKYQFLSEEASIKIMMGHRVTNPMMFGLLVPGRLGGGQELAESKDLFETNVLKPGRKLVKNVVKDLFAAMSIPVYWEMSSDVDPVAQWLIERGELMDGYELVHENPVDYDTDDELAIRLSFAAQPAQSGGDISDQDTSLFKIRYKYAGVPTSGQSRAFCRLMYSSDKVYKKEDIIAAENQRVNPGFGYQGDDTYNVWLYKGGPRCNHYWQRQVYLKSDNRQISVNEARKMIQALPVDKRDAAQYEINDPLVARHPNDMAHKGYHPNNPNKPADAR